MSCPQKVGVWRTGCPQTRGVRSRPAALIERVIEGKPTRCQRNVNDTVANGRLRGSTGALTAVVNWHCKQAQQPAAVYRSLR